MAKQKQHDDNLRSVETESVVWIFKRLAELVEASRQNDSRFDVSGAIAEARSFFDHESLGVRVDAVSAFLNISKKSSRAKSTKGIEFSKDDLPAVLATYTAAKADPGFMKWVERLENNHSFALYLANLRVFGKHDRVDIVDPSNTPSAIRPGAERDTVSEGETTVEQSLRRLNEIHEAVTEKVRGLITPFQIELEQLAGIEFTASDDGYLQSFRLLDSLHQRALELDQVLIWQKLPVFLGRRLPPAKKKGLVIWLIRDWKDGKVILDSITKFPDLSTRKLENDEATFFGRSEISRQRDIENLRLELRTWKGKGPETVQTKKGLVAKINKMRARARVSFGFVGEKTSFEVQKVTLRLSYTSFQLLKSTDSNSVFSSPEFPDLRILDGLS